jgi:hypothetical protein
VAEDPETREILRSSGVVLRITQLLSAIDPNVQLAALAALEPIVFDGKKHPTLFTIRFQLGSFVFCRSNPSTVRLSELGISGHSKKKLETSVRTNPRW